MTEPPSSPEQLPPPGWYPDPADASRLRWWDGQNWTEQVGPGVGAGPQPGPWPVASITPAGEWFGDTLRSSMTRFGHYLPLIVILLVPWALLSAYLTWGVLNEGVITLNVETAQTTVKGMPTTAGPYFGLAGAQILSLFFTYWLFGAVTDQTAHAGQENPHSWSESLSAAGRRLPRLLGGFVARLLFMLGFTAFFLVMAGLLSALFPALGTLVFIIGLPVVVVFLWTRLSLVGTVAMVDEGNPLSRSWRLTAGRFWSLVGRYALFVVAFFGLWLFTSVLGSVFGSGASGSPPVLREGEPIVFELSALLPANAALYAIGALFGALGAGLRQVILAVGLLGIHRDLTASEHN